MGKVIFDRLGFGQPQKVAENYESTICWCLGADSWVLSLHIPVGILCRFQRGHNETN